MKSPAHPLSNEGSRVHPGPLDSRLEKKKKRGSGFRVQGSGFRVRGAPEAEGEALERLEEPV